MTISAAIDLFMVFFPPAKNLKEANQFKTFEEIVQIISGFTGFVPDDTLTEMLRHELTKNGYQTDVLGNQVIWLIA